MTTNETQLSPIHNNSLGILFLRISIGGLMLFHGVNKIIHGIDGIISLTTAKGFPELMAYGIYIGEVLAPVLILIGFLTRPAAATVAFTMVMSIYLAFGWAGFELNKHGAPGVELNLMYLIGALALVFTGAGRYSVTKGQGPLN